MEMTLEVIRFLLGDPFFGVAAILYALGALFKRVAPDAARSAFWRWYRRTLPFHPVVVGMVYGWFVGDVVKFGASGVLACYAHDIYRTWVKHSSRE